MQTTEMTLSETACGADEKAAAPAPATGPPKTFVDTSTLKPAGDPVRLADRVQYDPDAKAALFAVSNSGSLVYLEGEGAGKSELAWVSGDGKDIGTIAPPAMFYSPRLSHDEKRVAVDLSDTQTASGDVWIGHVAPQAKCISGASMDIVSRCVGSHQPP